VGAATGFIAQRLAPINTEQHGNSYDIKKQIDTGIFSTYNCSIDF
jgi:hypothetical protein